MSLPSLDQPTRAAIARYLADALRHETEAFAALRSGRTIRSERATWWAWRLRRAAQAEENDPPLP